jgi:NADPH-dependent 2,4-dienoyl-CoA reductase/sulfur reductase-like enzyme
MADIRPCIGCCKGCIERVLALEEGTCVMNPDVGREYLLKKTDIPAKSKKILVVGAGPAGLAVARVAALRGHKVMILEENGHAGGMARLAAIAPGRSEIMECIAYYLRELHRLKVEIRLNTDPSRELIAEICPDVGIVATGSLPDIPQIAGLFDTGMALHTMIEVLQCRSTPGQRIVVLGGNMAALQVADFLADKGREVFVLHRAAHFAEQMAANDRTYLMERMKRPGIRLFKGVRIVEFLERGIRFLCQGQAEQLERITDIILSEGMRSNRKATDVFKEAAIEVHILGDAKSPRTLFEALAEADELGRAL